MSNYPICINENSTEYIVDCFDVVNDPDTQNKELRYISNVTLAGEHAGYFSITNFTPGYTDDGVSFCLKINNVQDAVAAGLGTLNVKTIITNEVSTEDYDNGWSSDGQDDTKVYSTGTHSISFRYASTIQIPGGYDAALGAPPQDNESPSFIIPSGLSLANVSKGVFVGYRGVLVQISLWSWNTGWYMGKPYNW